MASEEKIPAASASSSIAPPAAFVVSPLKKTLPQARITRVGKGGFTSSLAKKTKAAVAPSRPPPADAFKVRQDLLSKPTEFRRFYDRGDLPLSVDFVGAVRKVTWKVCGLIFTFSISLLSLHCPSASPGFTHPALPVLSSSPFSRLSSVMCRVVSFPSPTLLFLLCVFRFFSWF